MQADLAKTLERIADEGPAGFYTGKTARLLETEMKAHGGLITRHDLGAYSPVVRKPLLGSYHGLEILCAPPPSSGGQVLLETLNQLEGFDLATLGHNTPPYIHLLSEAMRRSYADRAYILGDPAFNPDLSILRFLSKPYAEELRRSVNLKKASKSSTEGIERTKEGEDTTHISVVDAQGNTVSLTVTLEDNYGSKIVVPGAGFLLNNEMGDFNAGPGITTPDGLIGTKPNLAQPGKRMLSSMCPAIVLKNGKLCLVLGSPGGRTIPNTVLQILLAITHFGMDAQAAVTTPRFHHQWLPDRIDVEQSRFPEDTLRALRTMGHTVHQRIPMGCAQIICVRPDGSLEAGADPRWEESAAMGF